jgi:hypothetical protein
MINSHLLRVVLHRIPPYPSTGSTRGRNSVTASREERKKREREERKKKKKEREKLTI